MTDDVQVRHVYRYGAGTDDALTPRVKDTVANPGSQPGLSVNLVPPGPAQKAQKVDVRMLVDSGLAFLPDDPKAGGRSDHGIIAPVDPQTGSVDIELLREWASTRGTRRRHRLTQAILDAIVERDVRSSS